MNNLSLDSTDRWLQGLPEKSVLPKPLLQQLIATRQEKPSKKATHIHDMAQNWNRTKPFANFL